MHKKFGQNLLIQFEDFARRNAYYLLERYRNQFCVFNDDIQGTASVALAGLLACHKHTGRRLSAEKIVFFGAGSAAMGIAEMCAAQMEREGITRNDAYSRIYLMDSKGLITQNRLHMEKEHKPYAKAMSETGNLLQLIKIIQPTVLIGTSTVQGAFNEAIIRQMAEINLKPIIFALSNPTKNAECTAEQAIHWTNGEVLFASGSPFENVSYKGKLYKPGQGNNSYIFPGVGMAAILFRIRHIDNEIFLIAAQNTNNTPSTIMHLLWYSNNIFSIVRRNTLHIARIFSTASVIPDKVDVASMTDKDLELYKLYRPERVIPPMRGIDLIKSTRYSKGMAFNLYERQYLGIHGLLPPAFMTEEQQAYRIISKLREQPNDLARYVQLDGLQDRNEKLFYRVVCEHVKELMPIVYTPTVGLACQNFGYIYRHPKGIYVTINDNSISKIHHILSNWPEKDVRAIVVTDGERILGLGDLGTYGMGIPVGKLALYVALGGVQPRWCLPVLLDVGTNKEELLQDPFYIGLRRKRVRGKEYDSFIENFMKACAKRFGQKVLIQFEDFANANAYRLLEKFRDKYCTFNDDIQGTASVVVAGLLSCNKILHKKMSEQTFVFLGAGAAATGIADLCVLQMQHEGLGEIEAHERIYLMNSKGLITRSSPNLKDEHQLYAKDMESIKDLIDVIKKVQPTGIIGVSTVSGSFSEEIIKEMSKINEHPIIFALSNPTNKSECTAEEAFTHTNGKVLFASGSPFPDLRLNGKLYKPGQGNNSYVFPGVALGVILFQVRHIDDELFLIAARQIADMVTEKDIKFGRIYPNLKYIRECSIKIALAIAKHCYANGTAALYPEPEDLEKYIRSQIYSVEYDELIDVTYEWPQEDMKHGFPVPVARRESVEE